MLSQRALQLDAASTLLTALEALLRVHDFDAFETAVPLVDLLQLDGRERREQLARMYLRRGFLESAADEWIAAIHERPDAQAFVGLAQVAVANQLPEEALDFVHAALDLEPEHHEARRLSDALERRLAA